MGSSRRWRASLYTAKNEGGMKIWLSSDIARAPVAAPMTKRARGRVRRGPCEPAGAAGSAALLGALAGVLLAARGGAAFQADLLAATGPGHGVAGQGRRLRGGNAVGFGTNFLGHEKLG